MNCPQCGKFMALVHFEPEGPTGAAYGWFCNNDECLYSEAANGLEDHRYDWLAYGISDEELEAVKADGLYCYTELAAEQAAMRKAYESTKRKKHQRKSPE